MHFPIFHRLSACAAALIFLARTASAVDQILVEAESFHDPGGWVPDTQFIEIPAEMPKLVPRK